MAGFTEEELTKIDALIKYLLDKLHKKIEKSGQKAYEGMLELFSPEQLAIMLMNGSKQD